MPRFPNKEPEIVALAESLWRGLWFNRTVYPQPPAHPMLIRNRSLVYREQRETVLTKQAGAEAATTTKDEALEDLVDALKANIRYAENTVKFDDDKLKLIGWAGKKTKTSLKPPGQSRLLEAHKQGDGWVFLDWKKPSDGGRPRAYKIQRRNSNNGDWADIATAIITEATLVEQPQREKLEYRVLAVNKAGESQPSNMVTVVL